MKDKVKLLAEFIRDSKYTVFFGGAGVSTESGIPDFRSKDGLYNEDSFAGLSPEFLLSNDCFMSYTDEFYDFCRKKMDVRKYEPNITHKVLAKMEENNMLRAIVTQNIDGLHQKAGSKNVCEIHGTLKRNYCERCGKLFSEDYIYEQSGIPKCSCGGYVRPGITLYGERLPQRDVMRAVNEIKNADVLIIGGTSLKVYPANTFVNEFSGKHLVVIDKKPLNVYASDNNDLMIAGSLGEVFSELEIELEL